MVVELGKRKIYLFISILLFLITFFYFIISKAVFSYSNIDEIMNSTDSYLIDNEYKLAEKNLNLIKRFNLSRGEWTRVLSRYFKIARATNNYKDLDRETFWATYFHPDAKEFWALRIKVLILNKKYEEAKKLALKNLDNSAFNSLRTEAIFMSVYSGDINKVIETISNISDPDLIHTFAEEMSLPVLYYNEALLWLERGDIAKAKELLAKMDGPDTPRLGQALIAYDAEDYNYVINQLADSNDQNLVPMRPPKGATALSEQEEEELLRDAHFMKSMLVADSQLMLENFETAYESYLKLLSLGSKKFFQPWINVVLLSDMLDKNIDPISWYKKALLNFPTQKNLTMAYVRELDYSDEGKKLIEKLLKISPYDPELNVFWYEFFDKGTTVNKRSSELWNIYNNFSFHSNLAQYMIWFFNGVQEQNSAKMVIDYYTGKDTSWVNFYDATIDLVFKSYDIALDKFQRLDYKSWEAYFNMALIYIYKEDYQKALLNIDTAEQVFRSDTDGLLTNILAKFYAKRGAIYIFDRNKQMAIENANKALEIDSENLEAKRILNDATLLF